MASDKSLNTPQDKSFVIIDLLICLTVVLVLFLPTINRPWLYYDEGIIFKGGYYPTPTSFGEIFEFIKEFGFAHTLISSNTIYSSNYVTRSCPLDQLFGMLIDFFLKKNALAYHIFNLTLHLINTSLVYFILRTCLKKRFVTILLASIWAVHPTMMEAILLSTNWGATFCYLFFFAFLLDFIKNRGGNNSLIRNILIPLTFFILLLKNEQIISLPLILFIISFHNAYKENNFLKSIKKSLFETRLYFTGFIIYLVFFFFFSNYHSTQHLQSNSCLILLERIFWLSPQIFFHLIKLIFYPKVLSIDQSLFVRFGKTIFDPYSIFCTLFFACWLLIPLFLFLRNRGFPNLFLLTWGLFFTLLPFLHILMPSYSLANERYLYAPLLIFIYGVARILSDKKIILFVILILCFVRSFYRTLDWKDNVTFINSTYEVSQDPLFKAIKLGMHGKVIEYLEPDKKEEAKEYFIKTLSLLQKARKETKLLKSKYQKSLPLIIKSYGLDYESRLAKIAYLEASSRCIELDQHYSVGLKLLKPYMKRAIQLDANTFELYTHFLILDKKYNEAKGILLKANSLHPHISFILMTLYDLCTKFENDFASGENYLKEALKYYPYDINILAKAFAFYQGYKDPLVAAKYAYRYGLRIQSDIAYAQALAIYLDFNKLNEAGKIAPKLLKIAPNSPDILYIISRYYYKTKNYQKSLSILQDAYTLSIKSPAKIKLALEVGITIAKVYLQIGDREKAAFVAKNILSLAGNDIESLTKLANLYKTLGLNNELDYCIKKIKQ